MIMALAERKLLCKNFSKSHDPDMTTPTSPAWLVLLESTILDVSACQNGDHTKKRNLKDHITL